MSVSGKTSEFTEATRAAATGRWLEILQSVAGIPGEVLDGAHHPCPKCGGTDRFRAFDDVAITGGVICNQCHAKKNGDGFAAVGWSLGVKFPAAVKLVAEYCGAAVTARKSGAKKGGDVDPAKDLVWRPWSSTLAAYFLAAKPGISEQALLDAGARIARYKKTTPSSPCRLSARISTRQSRSDGAFTTTTAGRSRSGVKTGKSSAR